MDETEAIVIDHGSFSVKAGFAGNDEPSVTISPVITKGDSGTALQYIIKDGLITDWEEMTKIWRKVFEELQINPEKRPMFLTEPPLNPKASREKMAQIMFETFHVPALFIANQAVLALYEVNSLRTTGVVLMVGEDVTYSVPIYSGYSMPHATTRLDLGGRKLTDYLTELLIARGDSVLNTSEREVVRDIKERVCSVAKDYSTQMESETDAVPYELPSGQVIHIGKERFQCAEALCQPSLAGVEGPGISELIYQSIMKCDYTLERELYTYIVVAGGSTLFPGFAERLRQEIVYLAPSTQNVRVVASPTRKHAAWIGGSILASMPSNWPMWVLKEEYEDSGVHCIHRMCL